MHSKYTLGSITSSVIQFNVNRDKHLGRIYFRISLVFFSCFVKVSPGVGDGEILRAREGEEGTKVSMCSTIYVSLGQAAPHTINARTSMLGVNGFSFECTCFQVISVESNSFF